APLPTALGAPATGTAPVTDGAQRGSNSASTDTLVVVTRVESNGPPRWPPRRTVTGARSQDRPLRTRVSPRPCQACSWRPASRTRCWYSSCATYPTQAPAPVECPAPPALDVAYGSPPTRPRRARARPCECWTRPRQPPGTIACPP